MISLGLQFLSLLVAALILAGCGKYRVGDQLYSRDSGALIGVVIETGQHDFHNGVPAGDAVHYRRPDGTDVWGSLDTVTASFEVRGRDK